MKATKIILIIYAILAYLPYACLFSYSFSTNQESQIDFFSGLFLISMGLYFVFWVISIIVILCHRKDAMNWDMKDALLFISVIKSVLVPAYVLNYVFGFCCLLLGFFFGFPWLMIPFFFAASFFHVIVTSLLSTILFNDCRKLGMLDSMEGIVLCLTQWVFCIDFVTCWVGTIMVRKRGQISSGNH